MLKGDLNERVEAIIKNGFEYVEIQCNFIKWPSQSDINVLKSKLTDVKVVGHAPFLDLNLCSPNIGIRSESLNQVTRAIELVSRLGGDLITLHLGRLPAFSASKEELNEISTEKKLKCFNFGIKSLEKLKSISEAHKITLCVENTPQLQGEFGSSPEDLEKALAIDGIQFTLDVGHANTISDNFVFELIERFGNKLKNVHLHDNDGNWDQHKAIGDGNVPIKKILTRLRDIDYTDSLILELNMGRALKSRDILSEIIR